MSESALLGVSLFGFLDNERHRVATQHTGHFVDHAVVNCEYKQTLRSRRAYVQDAPRISLFALYPGGSAIIVASGLWDDKNYSRCLEPFEAMDGAVPELARARTWGGMPLVAGWSLEMRWRPCEPRLKAL